MHETSSVYLGLSYVGSRPDTSFRRKPTFVFGAHHWPAKDDDGYRLSTQGILHSICIFHLSINRGPIVVSVPNSDFRFWKKYQLALGSVSGVESVTGDGLVNAPTPRPSLVLVRLCR